MSILLAILIFEAIIIIHELGHFIAAKASGVKVNEFAIGMEGAVALLPGQAFIFCLLADWKVTYITKNSKNRAVT